MNKKTIAFREGRYSDPRVEEFYQVSINAENPVISMLIDILRTVFSITSDTQLDKILLMLDAHKHLTPNYLRDICDSIQAKIDGKPINLTRYTDIILRYNELVANQGAQVGSWNALVKRIKDGEEIASLKPYAVRGEMHVQGSILRPLDDKAIGQLREHKLIGRLRELLNNRLININELMMDYFDEEGIPHKAKALVLGKLDLTYDRERGIFTRNGSEIILTDEDLFEIMTSLIEILPSEKLSSIQIDKINEYIIWFYLRYLENKYPHFKENLEKLERLLGEIEKAEGENLGQVFKEIYQSAIEIFIHGIMDYPQGELASIIKDIILKIGFSREDIVRTISSWGEAVPEGVNLIEYIGELSHKYEKRVEELRKSDVKDKNFQKEVNVVIARLKYLNSLNLEWMDKIKASDTIPELAKVIQEVFNGRGKTDLGVKLANIFRMFKESIDNVRGEIRSFGKYFEEQPTGEIFNLRLIPVKGIGALLAIDTGSDCGKGLATLRGIREEVTIYLITDSKSQKALGYIGLYEAKAGNELLLQVDVMNPSTQLNISGSSFLDEIRKHFKRVISASEGKIKGILVYNEASLVSNRESISKAVDLDTMPKAEGIFGKITSKTGSREESEKDNIKETKKEISDKVEGLILKFKNTVALSDLYLIGLLNEEETDYCMRYGLFNSCLHVIFNDKDIEESVKDGLPASNNELNPAKKALYIIAGILMGYQPISDEDHSDSEELDEFDLNSLQEIKAALEYYKGINAWLQYFYTKYVSIHGITEYEGQMEEIINILMNIISNLSRLLKLNNSEDLLEATEYGSYNQSSPEESLVFVQPE